jgi:Cof subfamily protein (haloacid dehalogenase superfamily)
MTPPQDIRLLIADVDGTLVTHDKVLTRAAIAACRDLKSAGVGVALTSARPPAGMRMLIEPLGIDLPLAGFNGGLITAPDLSPIEGHPIAPETAQAAIRLIGEAGLQAWIYTADAWFVSRREGPLVDREAWIIKLEPKLASAPRDLPPGPAYKIVGVGDDPSRLAAAEAGARDKIGAAATIARSSAHYLDITDASANKGLAARSLARRLGLEPAQIAAIGDMPNDVLMFRECGLSIAMGNADESVKANASTVTDSNEDEGFANAVRRLLLAQTPLAGDRRAV